MLDRAAWIISLVLLPVLWGSGIRLFAQSELDFRRKILWSAFLVAVGACVGLLLPPVEIRNRFLMLLALLPLLALVDVKLARSRRGFLFWLRACSFEVCTVFACAAFVRAAIDLR